MAAAAAVQVELPGGSASGGFKYRENHWARYSALE
jgi:hypothetical protein